MEHAAQARGWSRVQLERCPVRNTNSNMVVVGRIPSLCERWHHCAHYDSLPSQALITKLFLGTNRLIWEPPNIYIHHEYLVEESHMISLLSQFNIWLIRRFNSKFSPLPSPWLHRTIAYFKQNQTLLANLAKIPGSGVAPFKYYCDTCLHQTLKNMLCALKDFLF